MRHQPGTQRGGTAAATDERQEVTRGSDGGAEDGSAAGSNPVGQVIKAVYGIGGPHTIRWGLLKRPVVPPQQDGKSVSWEEHRRQTEPRRAELRKQFEERLEVISSEERARRAKVGYLLLGATAAAAAAAAAVGASTGVRIALSVPLFLGIGFVDSSIKGLCTESWAGAWDVDDTGLEYMPSANLARRIQGKVARLYARDWAITAALVYGLCRL